MASPIERSDTSQFETTPDRHSYGTPGTEARIVVSTGVTWTVYEDRKSYVGPSLIFESDKISRRVRNYPPDWAKLTDEKLIALSSSR